jgi:hypothetical protein
MVGIRSPDGLVVGSCISHPRFWVRFQTRGTRENRAPPCVKVPGSSWVPTPPWVGCRSPLGWWLGLHQPPWSFGFDSREEPGKTGRHAVLKYRVPHGSQSSSSQDQQDQQPPKPIIPSQRRVTEQLTKNWAPFKALRQHYAGTRLEEQRQLHLPQKHKPTVADSTLRVEMNGLEEQADNAKAREIFWMPLSWLGTLRPTSANGAFDPALWETFVLPCSLSSLPRLNNSSLAKCGCKKYVMDLHCDHTATCTAHSGATKTHDWMVSTLGGRFRTAGHTVRTQHGVTASAGQRRGDVEIWK